MSKAAIAARKQGNYWEASSLLYEKQPKKMEDLLKIAEKLNFDKEKFVSDIESIQVKEEIKDELSKAEMLQIDATPTMIINEEKLVGVKPYYELKEILIKHGAKKR
jgi:protein-disulfide isomerase